MRTEVPDCARSAARLGGGFKEDPLRPVWSRHDHRIAVGGEQLAFQLVLLIGLIPVDVKEQYQSEWGVGVWHCRQPSPSAWTFPDWASACAASDRNRLTLMSPPLRSNSRVPIPPLSFPNVQLAEGRSIPHPLRLTPSRRQDNTWRPVDLCCAIWAVAAGADRRGTQFMRTLPLGQLPGRPN